jgi:hypothetical protein
MQILGLTWESIKAQAEKILGPKVVAYLVGAFDIFMIIKDQGIGGLWEYIKDQVGNLADMVIDGIKDLVKSQVIEAGIQWLLGILGGPAGAFIKAAKAIIDIVMWFVNNGSRVMALVNSVLDSVSAIASGSLGEAAAYIEKSLANAIPVMIGFLASLLGLGNLSQKIKGVIEKVQAPVKKAIGWVLGKAKAFASKVMGKVKGGKKKEESKEEKEKKRRWQGGLRELNRLKERSSSNLRERIGQIRQKYQFNLLEVSGSGEDQQVHAVMRASIRDRFLKIGGHGHQRHGAQTTESQHRKRLETGKFPEGGRGNPPTASSKFTSHQKELEARSRAEARLRTLMVGPGSQLRQEVTFYVNVKGAGFSYRIDQSGRMIRTGTFDSVFVVYRLGGDNSSTARPYGDPITIHPRIATA